MARTAKYPHKEIWKDIQELDEKKERYPNSDTDIAKKYNISRKMVSYIRRKYQKIQEKKNRKT